MVLSNRKCYWGAETVVVEQNEKIKSAAIMQSAFKYTLPQTVKKLIEKNIGRV